MATMDLVRISSSSERAIIKTSVSREYFITLMKRARNKFGLKSKDNPNGFFWNVHDENRFHAGGAEYRLEWAGDLDMDFLRK